jgi:hypothetical protein
MAKQFIRSIVLAAAVTAVFGMGNGSTAAEPGWSPVVIATGEYRETIKSMPIEQRPYRPFHFYGNTIRRNHYRGNPVVMPRDIVTTTQELARRR